MNLKSKSKRNQSNKTTKIESRNVILPLKIKYEGGIMPIVDEELPRSSCLAKLINTSITYKLLQDVALLSERIHAIDSYKEKDKLEYTMDALGAILKGGIKALSTFFTRSNHKAPFLRMKNALDNVRGLDSKLTNFIRILAETCEIFTIFIGYDFEIQKKLQEILIQYREMEEQVGLLKIVLSQFKPETLTGPLQVTVKRELKIKSETKDQECQTERASEDPLPTFRVTASEPDPINSEIMNSIENQNTEIAIINPHNTFEKEYYELKEKYLLLWKDTEKANKEKNSCEMVIKNIQAENSQLIQCVESLKRENASKIDEMALEKQSLQDHIESLKQEIANLNSDKAQIDNDMKIATNSCIEKDNILESQRLQIIKLFSDNDLLSTQISEIQNDLISEKQCSELKTQTFQVQIQELSEKIQNLEAEKLERTEVIRTLNNNLQDAVTKAEKLQEDLDAITETDSLISNYDNQSFNEKVQSRLEKNNALIFYLTQKTFALRSILIDQNSVTVEPIIERDQIPLEVLRWHEGILQELEHIHNKQTTEQKQLLVHNSRLLTEKEFQISSLSQEKSILLNEISELKSQNDGKSAEIQEISKKMETQIKQLELKVLETKETMQLKEEEQRKMKESYEQVIENLKSKLLQMSELNKEMEKSISMSVVNQNILLEQIGNLGKKVETDENTIKDCIHKINILKTENQNLISIKKEQETLIYSLAESQKNSKDADTTNNIQEIQKAIQGNNYMILFLERKNYEYRKRVLKSSLQSKKKALTVKTHALYEEELVGRAMQAFGESRG